MNLSISQRYLKKIGFNREFSPTLENLQELLSLHVQNIPFGNLAPFLGDEVLLDPQVIADKLLDQGREGYCLEQSTLTKIVLNELGFETFNLLGRVYYQNMKVEMAPTRTHLVTIVKIDGILYLYDPGFGGMTPAGVLSLNEVNAVQQTPLEKFRLIDVKDTDIPEFALTGMKFMLQAYVKEIWMNVYAFNPEQAVAESDLILANWYVSTSPKSVFTQNLMFSIIKNNEKTSLNNNVLRTHGKLGSTKKELVTIEDYQSTLKSVFNVNIEQIDFLKVFNKINNSVA
ncbi:arylamine N-acetyltransferase family protein [Acinetobacter sp. ANC 4470]|uniref:arylamine N-acetyltransferase family protein n=1 Tax=Acinetobacter sp. ANC 4470 TaxID=1977881 RepID=UPI000A32FFAE|nr:arylamine N-acetyltransferase [Acinetobacter sp. ANC 4470]